MIQFAISEGFNVRSTTFPHKDIYKDAWYSADGTRANQIHHVSISNRFRSAKQTSEQNFNRRNEESKRKVVNKRKRGE